ncbi:FadR/GntR family transcriptional regulator [Neisseriaceae bacterium CLB008]
MMIKQKPVRSAQIAAQMEALIVDGTWPLDSQIPTEPELMAQFDVGRNTLREAIRALAHAGLVSIKQGCGTYVRATNPLDTVLTKAVAQTSFEHAMEVRLALETSAALWAGQRRTDADVAMLRQCRQEVADAAAAGERQAYLAADMRLHHAIVAAAHNPLLSHLYESLAGVIQANVAHIVNVVGVDEGYHTHTDLVEAIIAGEGERAQAEVLSSTHRFQQLIKEQASL